MELAKNQPAERKKSIEKLKGYLLNPGRFSILILGMRGTGKTHWLYEIHKSLKGKLDTASNIIEVNALLMNQNKKEDWLKIFNQANNSILVVNDVEKLDHYSQELLFDGLSTHNGKFGYEKKQYAIRIVFTSTFDIKALRENNRILLNKFFDRISQLVVVFPSFQMSSSKVVEDFNSVWNYMKFSSSFKPSDEMKEWISLNAEKFHGNFRDLQKLAINYHNYLIQRISENEILPKLKSDFEEYIHYPDHKTSESHSIQISDEMDYRKDILPNLQLYLKQRAIEKYGKLRNAPNQKPFGVAFRSMERW